MNLRAVALICLVVSTSVFAQPSASTVHIGIRGMVCGFCSTGLKKHFTTLKGVTKVDVSLEKKEIVLQLEPGATLDNELITERVKDAGFEVTTISR